MSENVDFAQRVIDAGLVFIGPTPENIRRMGEKIGAVSFVQSIGIPVLTSSCGTVNKLLDYASEMDFPIMVKASGGGGGKGMVICDSADELLSALQKAERQAISYFGNGELLVEKYLPRARHIEVQLLADNRGNVLHFFDRECSVQRRFQKIIEEAPSPSVDEKLRFELCSAAVKIAKSMNYRNAGTIEFLLDETGKFYFLEMNTRIQVEHPVTEMITHTDLVSLQLSVAAGNPLLLTQEDIRIDGHAIEVRFCAEDTEHSFRPSAGKLALWEIPKDKNLRVETFVQEGNTISVGYDSLLAKLIVWGQTRDQTIDRMQLILAQTYVAGIQTNLPFLVGLVGSVDFRTNKIFTRYVDENLGQINKQIQDQKNTINKDELVIAYLIFHFYSGNDSGNSVWNQIGFWRMNHQVEVLIDGEKLECRIGSNEKGQVFEFNQRKYWVSSVQKDRKRLELEINRQPQVFYNVDKGSETEILYQEFAFSVRSNLLLNQALVIRQDLTRLKVFQNCIYADLFGRVLKISVQEGDTVEAGQVLLILESMKTEINMLCPANATVKKIHVAEGNAVMEKQLLVEIAPLQLLPEMERPGLGN